MKCPTCEKKIRGDWNYCPVCGTEVSEPIGEFLTDKASYLSLRDGNIPLIQENFESVK